MDQNKLKEIIAAGESLEVELKLSFHSVQEIAKTLCAFANTQGGVLVLGVDQKGKIAGITKNLDEVQQKISAANNLVHAAPLIKVEIIELEHQKVIVILVHKSDSSRFHSFEGVIYARIGSTTHRLEGDSILEFLRYRQILLFEEGIEPSATLEDIDQSKIQEYLERRQQADYFKYHTLQNLLLSKKLATSIPDFKLKNIALLFFAKQPQYFFPYALVKLVRFDGIEAVKVLAYEQAEGTPSQMIDQTLSFFRRFISKEFVIKGIKREEISLLPEEALRESIINAVAHRDYFDKNEIQVSIFDDRIEVTNPGGLPEGMSREMLGILSIQRNPQIYQFLKDYGYMEGIGSGISKMYTVMKAADLQKPEFVFSKSFFRIILRIKKIEEIELAAKLNLNQRQVKVFDYLRANKKIKTMDYARLNNISVPTALKDLHKLEKEKLIKKIGKFKGAYYLLSEEK